MKNLKKIKLNINYDFSFLLKPLMLLSFLSAVIYGLKLLGISEGDKIFFVLMILVLVPVTLNQIKTVNYKISLIMVLFVFVILYIFIYDDLLLFLAEKSRNNGVIFGVINSIFNTFGLSEFENMIFHTSFGGAKLMNGQIVTGAADIYAMNQSIDASIYLCGRYFSLFSALGIAFSIKKHKKAVLFLMAFAFLSGNFTIYLLTLLLFFTPYYFIFLLFNFISYFIANIGMINGGFAVGSSVFELFVYCDNYIYILAVGFFMSAVSYYFSRLAKERLKW